MLVLSFLFLVFYSRYFPILLLLELIILPIILYGLLIIMKRSISIELKTLNEYGSKNNESIIELSIFNKCILPISKVDISIVYEDNMRNKIDKIIRLSIDGRNKRNLRYSIKPQRCGVVKVYVNNIIVYDYFSLFSKRKNTYKEDKFIVLPNIHIFSSDILGDGSKIESDSDTYSEYEEGNDPSQVFDIREYIEGDKIQRIHWKLSTKYDELMVKEYSLPVMESTLILIELFANKSDSKYGELVDGLIEATYSISNYLISKEYPHSLAWYNENSSLEKVEINSKDDLLYAIKKVLEAPIYDNNLYALKEYCNLKTKESNSKIIYMSTKVNKEIVDEINIIGTKEDNKIVLLASLEGSEVAFDSEEISNTNIVDVNSFEESLDRVII